MTQKSATVLITLTMMAAYLALAVRGSGGLVVFFEEPARIALTIATFGLTVAWFFTDGHVRAGEREDSSYRWVGAVLLMIGLLDAYLPAYTERTGFWLVGGNATRWLGVVLYTAGGALQFWTAVVLGRRFGGIGIKPGHTLATSGIYSLVRHPSYLGMFVCALGWGLAFRSGVGVLLAACTIPLLMSFMRAEEVLLRSEFGSEHEFYCKCTSRLIPGLY